MIESRRRMRYFALVWCASLLFNPQSLAQKAATSPQSARQALIEMFMGKESNDFTKHLPDEARRALIHKGEGPDISIALRISAFTRAMATEEDHVETFDAGPNLLVSEQLESHERTEIAAEHDSLMGENDEIELSVHIYKDGQPQKMGNRSSCLLCHV